MEIQNSKILPPTTAFPVATIYILFEDSVNIPKIQFSPVPVSGTYTYTLVYVRKPPAGVFAYNFNSTTGNFTYNSTCSVDIDISDRYYTDIITRALMYLGISLRDGDVAGVEGLMDQNQRSDER